MHDEKNIYNKEISSNIENISSFHIGTVLKGKNGQCLFVLRQPNGVMSSAVSLPNHTFTGQA